MTIHWAELGKVAWVSLAFAVGIALVFALGVLGAGQVATARAGLQRVRGYAVAASCFTACGAAALFGIYLIVPQFHR